MAPQPEQEDACGVKVLIAEDDAVTRKLFTALLKRAGHEPWAFADGQQAWEAYEREPTAVCITDWLMPEVSGVELCRLIKSTEATAGIPVLMFTSYTEVESQVASTDAGADAYIPKGSDLRIMQARIDALLREKTRQSEASQKDIATAQRQTLSQTVVTLAHHINNSLMSIHATASVVDVTRPEHAERLKSVCRNEVRKMFKVLTALKAMADEQELKTTTYVGRDVMFDLEAELKSLDT